ncbi:MAG: LON peptidase substrate-binding domain-containing protein [Planctomycetota bacterium]|nr:LON peptidase substrate-binding domain-containing protein [Planctomycetota bacterium]
MSTTIPSSPVPMFPLPGFFLYPAQMLPLHIFEPRYRQMIDESLDGHGRIIIGTALSGGETPPVLAVAGLGEIIRHEKLPDGRYHVWLLGLTRVRIEEAPSDRLYRMARCSVFDEIEASPGKARALKTMLSLATRSRIKKQLTIPPLVSTSVLTDLLMQTVQAPIREIEAIFAEPSIVERARMALAAHRRYPPTQVAENSAE